MKIKISVAIVVLGIGLPTALGFAWPAYNPVSDFLSELGASGAPHGAIMNYAGFLPIGVLWALGALSLLAGNRTALLWTGVLLLLGTSVSYIGAAFFPCDAGCPMEGSNSQMMHNALGVIGYLTSPIGLAIIGVHFLRSNQSNAGIISFAASAATLVGFVMMANPEMAGTRGAWQRLADFSLFIWLLVISVSLRNDQFSSRT